MCLQSDLIPVLEQNFFLFLGLELRELNREKSFKGGQGSAREHIQLARWPLIHHRSAESQKNSRRVAFSAFSFPLPFPKTLSPRADSVVREMEKPLKRGEKFVDRLTRWRDSRHLPYPHHARGNPYSQQNDETDNSISWVVGGFSCVVSSLSISPSRALSSFFFSLVLKTIFSPLSRLMMVTRACLTLVSFFFRVQGWSRYYPPITYYWTVPIFLDHSYLVGKITSSKIADVKVSGLWRF